ncbi:MAG: hypothetical protein JNM93_05925 [Bacteriovoracaceae bacterium]|nr:hypothetical protein [Bacteriovoracaceae bacterium]
MKSKEQIIFRSSSARSFFTYFLLGCFASIFVIYGISFFGLYHFNIERAVMMLGISTVIVCVVAPCLFLRTIEVTPERVVVKWLLLNRRKTIPYSLLDHIDRGNFLASPALKFYFKSGRVEKLTFVDHPKEVLRFVPETVRPKARRNYKTAS